MVLPWGRRHFRLHAAICAHVPNLEQTSQQKQQQVQVVIANRIFAFQPSVDPTCAVVAKKYQICKSFLLRTDY